MHIAHFTNTYKPNINGVVRSISTFREALLSLGHHIFVFAQETRDYVDAEPFVFRYPGFDIPRFDYSFTFPVSPFVDWLLPSLKLDVIHSNHPIVLGQTAADKAEKLSLPLVFTLHTRYTEYTNYVPISQAFLRGIIVELLVNYMERCQRVITPSNRIQNMLEEFGGIRHGVSTIPTGIDLVPFSHADGSKVTRKYNLDGKRVLISVGRLSMEKNWKKLIRAYSQVAQDYNDVHLLMVGDGPLHDELEDYAQELGIAERVTFTGLVPFDEIPYYLKAADLFCYASVSETQGLVIMEALAAGLPVAAIRATGTIDVVDEGVQGLLSEDDSTALSRAMIRILEDETLLRRFQAGAVEKAHQFDSVLQAEKITQVYEQAIEDKRIGRHIRINRQLLKETREKFGDALAAG